MSEAEYAALPEGLASRIEVVHGYAATRQYRAEAVMEHGIVLSYPYKVVVPFEELTD
jgi:hypothetical protein